MTLMWLYKRLLPLSTDSFRTQDVNHYNQKILTCKQLLSFIFVFATTWRSEMYQTFFIQDFFRTENKIFLRNRAKRGVETEQF